MGFSRLIISGFRIIGIKCCFLSFGDDIILFDELLLLDN